MDASDIRGKRVTVIGGARSGLAAARLLSSHGAEVFLTEASAPSPDLQSRLEKDGVQFEFGGHSARAKDADFAVISPGVPDTIDFVKGLDEKGTPVYSEIEVASWFCKAPIIAITGSNGKTTTTSLLGHTVALSGRAHVVAGNIGAPFSDYVTDLSAESLVVLEVSSFQLDRIDKFQPRVAVILNITPDHLDRYGGKFENYAASKLRLFENLQPQGSDGGDWLVYNHDDLFLREAVQAIADERGIQAYGFSLERELDHGGFIRNGELVLRLTPGRPGAASPDEEVIMRTDDAALPGRHNLYNSLAAAVAARAAEIKRDVVRESLSSFEGVPHRLEFVRDINGVRYVNDSKATNVNAVWYALESFKCPLVLIAGGRDKGNDYDSIKKLVKDRVRGIVGIGESGDKVLYELGALADRSARAHSMEEAIQYARLMAEPGDVVLLSPACASFDQFENYEERGDEFKRLVESL
ncbi:UDP-N-acetylmuramoyl-L-alanine--D-glutamate ligase [soil metagenome]